MLLTQLMSRAIVAAISLSLILTGYTNQALAGNRLENAAVIDKAYKTLKLRLLDNQIPQNEAIETFSNTLLSNSIGLKDILTYVRVHSTPEQYVSFENEIQSALKNTKLKNASPDEINLALTQAFATVQPQGLAVTGCFGLGAGIVLAVGALVVGIVALTKTKGEARIRSQYLNRMNNLTQIYTRDRYNIENRAAQIDVEITGLNGSIQSNTQRISFLTGAISAETDADRIRSYAAEIQILTRRNSEITSEINLLTIERTQYLNESFLADKLSQLERQYNLTYSQLEVERENRIALVPTEKALAGKLGITAGVTAALGAVLIVDGYRDCR